MMVNEKRYLEWYCKIQAICLQNDIAEIYFIIDRSDLHISFTVYLRMAEIFTDSPTGSQQIACALCHFQLFLTSCWEICKYQPSPDVF